LRPFLRGLYFTSATQEGTPMDRAIGGLARILGLSGRIILPSRSTAKAFIAQHARHEEGLGSGTRRENDLARILGLSGRIILPSRSTAKAFFVTRMLRDVVLKEAGLAGTNLRWQRRRASLAW